MYRKKRQNVTLTYLILLFLAPIWNAGFLSQFVSPLQYAHIYSEKLVHLPHCYFVNDYKQVGLPEFKPWFHIVVFLGTIKLSSFIAYWKNLIGCTFISFHDCHRKTGMFWIQIVSTSDQIMVCLKTNLYSHVSTNCTRWILKYLILGNFFMFFYSVDF